MSFVHILLLSFIEGITEFLPVSSTAHLFLGSKILGIPQTNSLSTFIIAIQIGAIIAGAIFILRTIKITKKVFTNAVVAFVPTAIIGFLVYPYVKNILFGNLAVVAGALLIGGIVILFVDRKENASDPASTSEELSYKNAFILGLVQTLAFIPGVSRSGALIIGGGLLKYSRQSIVIFTFLLGLPTLLAATVYDLYKSRDILTVSLGYKIILGAIVSGIIAYVVARWFLKYITNHTFKIFGYYRIVLGLILIIFFI
jgi:undecaprenyl-diphosphatase